MPVVIAPAPSRSPPGPNQQGQSASSTLPVLAYACQSCVRRKVKCDRASPICSSCTKAKLDCVYRAPPPPRPRKRKPVALDGIDGVESVHGRSHLSLRERTRPDEDAMVANGGGVSPRSPTPNTTTARSHQPSFPRDSAHSSLGTGNGPGTENPQPNNLSGGKLLSGNGKYRYIKSGLWLHAGDTNMRELCEHSDFNEEAIASQSNSTEIATLPQDPLSAVLLGVSQGLAMYHPSHDGAMKLWAAHVSNVDPLCKLLHVPSTETMVESISRQPAIASKSQECLLFSIYHSAVLSMSEEECRADFGRTRTEMLAMYQAAVRQALVNASWLQRTEMIVLQAYILYLITMRTMTDPHTYWILTGVAVRIAQRMGIHRDGDGDGLSPFDIEMRRRLFWQLLPLDAQVGQMSGSGISILPGSWDTKRPLNIDDGQIHPGMNEQPQVQKGATEMIFCLVKAELSNLFAHTSVRVKNYGPSLELKSGPEVEELMNEVEETIETKYLRYCDITSPLHFFTLGVARSAASIVRLRNKLYPIANTDINNPELRELCVLARKILDTDSAIYKNPMTRRFHWQIGASFYWDALKCILTSLARPGFYPPLELDATWKMVANFYEDHKEATESKGAIQTLIVRATLHAWRANPPSLPSPEPDFIVMLSSRVARDLATKIQDPRNLDVSSDEGIPQATSSMTAVNNNFDLEDVGFGDDLNLSVADWMFWYQSP